MSETNDYRFIIKWGIIRDNKTLLWRIWTSSEYSEEYDLLSEYYQTEKNNEIVLNEMFD